MPETNRLKTIKEVKKKNYLLGELLKKKLLWRARAGAWGWERNYNKVGKLVLINITRLSAEISNIKRNAKRKRQNALKYHGQKESLFAQTLNVIDNLEVINCLKWIRKKLHNKGVEMVVEGFLYALKKKGIESKP